MEAAEQIAEARESAGEKFKNHAAPITAFMAMLIAITSLGGGAAATLLMLNGYFLLLPNLF